MYGHESKGLVIIYWEGGGPKKLENRGPETFCASKQGKTFCAPLIKSGNFFVTLPLIWL